MKLKITKSDGTMIEAEGTVEEMERIAKAVTPIALTLSNPSPGHPGHPVWPLDRIVFPLVIPVPDDNTAKPPMIEPGIWCSDHAPSEEPKFEAHGGELVCSMPGKTSFSKLPRC